MAFVSSRAAACAACCVAACAFVAAACAAAACAFVSAAVCAACSAACAFVFAAVVACSNVVISLAFAAFAVAAAAAAFLPLAAFAATAAACKAVAAFTIKLYCACSAALNAALLAHRRHKIEFMTRTSAALLAFHAVTAFTCEPRKRPTSTPFFVATKRNGETDAAANNFGVSSSLRTPQLAALNRAAYFGQLFFISRKACDRLLLSSLRALSASL